MSIRTKTWLLVLLVVMVLGSSLIATAWLIILNGFHNLEAEFARRNLERAKNVLIASIEKMNVSAGDYASWGATYEFINNPNTTGYAKENFLASAFMNLKINCMLFFNVKRELVSQAFFRDTGSKVGTAPPAMVSAVLSTPGLVPQPDTSHGRYGLLKIGNAAVMVAARPILRDNGVGPSRGALVFCRYIDALELDRLSDIVGVPLSLNPVIADTCAAGLQSPSNPAPKQWIQTISRHQLDSYKFLSDLSGQRSFLLSCVNDRIIWDHGLKTFYYWLGWLITIIIVFAGVILSMLEFGILSRLGWLRASISAIKRSLGSTFDPAKRIVVQGTDEIATLAVDINNLLAGIEQARRRAETSEARYSCLFDQMLNGSVLFEIVNDEKGGPADYRFLDVNPSFERLTGLKRDGVVGRLFREIPSVGDSSWFNSLDRVVKSGEPDHFEAYSPQLQKCFEVMAFPAGAGQIGVTFTEITERKKSEEVREQIQEQLAQMQKMEAVGQLAGGIAHDFNNQMAGILGYAVMLRDQATPESKLARYANSIITGIRRASDLTAQLLAFARKGKYVSVPINMHKVILEVVDLLEHTIDKKVNIHQHFKALRAVCLGDPTQLQNVILNVALNARDAMPAGGDMTFVTDVAILNDEFCRQYSHKVVPGRFLCISISDTGIGMDEELIKRIFDPFFTTKPIGKGTGMGLAAAYGIIKNHHGAITVESRVGKGSTFSIYLPITDQEEAVVVKKGEMVKTIPDNPHILLVEDDPLVSEMAKDLLSDLGCRVSHCANGRLAVELYHGSWPQVDLVILDMSMPEMDGRQTFYRMKEINPQIKSLLATGYGIDTDAQELLNNGMIGFLQKPFMRDDLAAAILNALKGQGSV